MVSRLLAEQDDLVECSFDGAVFGSLLVCTVRAVYSNRDFCLSAFDGLG